MTGNRLKRTAWILALAVALTSFHVPVWAGNAPVNNLSSPARELPLGAITAETRIKSQETVTVPVLNKDCTLYHMYFSYKGKEEEAFSLDTVGNADDSDNYFISREYYGSKVRAILQQYYTNRALIENGNTGENMVYPEFDHKLAQYFVWAATENRWGSIREIAEKSGMSEKNAQWLASDIQRLYDYDGDKLNHYFIWENKNGGPSGSGSGGYQRFITRLGDIPFPEKDHTYDDNEAYMQVGDNAYAHYISEENILEIVGSGYMWDALYRQDYQSNGFKYVSYNEGGAGYYASRKKIPYIELIEEMRDRPVKVIIRDGITGIGAFAFPTGKYTNSKGNTYIESFTIEAPEKIEYIGSYVFDGTNGRGAFQGHPQQYKPVHFTNRSLNLSSLKIAGEGAFFGIDGVESITLGENLKYISTGSFGNILSLKEINYNAKNAQIIGCPSESSRPVIKKEQCYRGLLAFVDDNDIKTGYGNKRVSAGCSPFMTTTDVESSAATVNIGNSVEYLAPFLFSGCNTDRINISVSSNLKFIDGGCFACTSISSLTIPQSVEWINAAIVQDCPNLRSVYYNAKHAKRAGRDLINGKSSYVRDDEDIEAQSILSSGALEDLYLFSMSSSDHLDNEELDDVKYTVYIGPSVETIPNAAFCNDNHLFTLDFTDASSLKSIPDYFCNHYSKNAEEMTDSESSRIIFNYKTHSWQVVKSESLTNIIGLENTAITEIGKDAFCYKWGNDTLTQTIELPDTVRVIYEGAFYGLNRVKHFVLHDGISYCSHDRRREEDGQEYEIPYSADDAAVIGEKYFKATDAKYYDSEDGSYIDTTVDIDTVSQIEAEVSLWYAAKRGSDKITISFNSLGGTPIPSQIIRIGERPSNPVSPQRDGSVFIDWYSDQFYNDKADFSVKHRGNRTYYAMYRPLSVKTASADSVVYGKGKAYANLQLITDDGCFYLSNRMIKCRFEDGSEFDGRTDDYGRVDIAWTIDSGSEVLDPLGKEKKKQVRGEVFLNYLTGLQKTHNITMNVTIKPLSFTQSWEAGCSAGIEGSIGPEAGIGIGPAKAKAALCRASASDEVGVILNVENEYDSGIRNLALKEEFSNKISVEGSLGPTAEAKACTTNINVSGLAGKAGITNGTTLALGTKINDYDPEDRDDRLDMGRFLLGTTAMSLGSAILLHLAEKLGFDAYNYYGFSDTIAVNAGVSILEAEVDGVIDGEGALASAKASRAYKVSVEKNKADDENSVGVTKTSEIEGKIGTIDVGFNNENGTFASSDTSFYSKKLLNNEYSMTSVTNTKTKEQSVLIKGLLGYDDTGVLGADAASREECVFSYSGNDLNRIKSDIPKIKKFTSGDPLFLFDTSMEKMYDSLDKTPAKAVYSKSHSEENRVNFPLSLAASLGVGLEGTLSFSGASSLSYEYEQGEYKNGKMYIRSKNDIRNAVEDKKTDILTLLAEPIAAVADEAGKIIEKATNIIGETVEEGFVKIGEIVGDVVDEVRDRYVSVFSIKGNRTNRSGNPLILSVYEPVEELSSEKHMLKEAGDTISKNEFLEGNAVTIGDSYIILVSKDWGCTDVIDKFEDSPLKLTLGFTDEYLSDSGVSVNQIDHIEIYKYSEDLKGYVSVGGSVDRKAKEVSTIITESGEYVLALVLPKAGEGENNEENQNEENKNEEDQNEENKNEEDQNEENKNEENQNEENKNEEDQNEENKNEENQNEENKNEENNNGENNNGTAVSDDVVPDGGNEGGKENDGSGEKAGSDILSETSTRSFNAGSDAFVVSWNTFVRFDGTKHNGVGTDVGGNTAGVKESGKKVYDLKLFITKNGEAVDPSAYSVKAKNNRNASVSTDGITPIGSGAKKPSYKIRFKGKDYKEANKTVKGETFEFGIIPAELKQDNITFDKVKTGKDGSLQIKKLTYKPEADAGGVTPKPQKLKLKKDEAKTDYVTETNPDGSVTVTGRNNYYGSVIYKP